MAYIGVISHLLTNLLLTSWDIQVLGWLMGRNKDTGFFAPTSCEFNVWTSQLLVGSTFSLGERNLLADDEYLNRNQNIPSLKLTARFFQVTFWSPKWRSLSPWKGHLNPPKRSLGRNWSANFSENRRVTIELKTPRKKTVVAIPKAVGSAATSTPRRVATRRFHTVPRQMGGNFSPGKMCHGNLRVPPQCHTYQEIGRLLRDNDG